MGNILRMLPIYPYPFWRPPRITPEATRLEDDGGVASAIVLYLRILASPKFVRRFHKLLNVLLEGLLMNVKEYGKNVPIPLK